MGRLRKEFEAFGRDLLGVLSDVATGFAVILGVKLVQVGIEILFGPKNADGADFVVVHHYAGLVMYVLVSALGVVRIVERIWLRFVSIRRVSRGEPPLDD